MCGKLPRVFITRIGLSSHQTQSEFANLYSLNQSIRHSQSRIFYAMKSIKRREEGSKGTLLIKLDNGKRYAHTAASTYHITMASLQPDDRPQPNCACNVINESKGPANQDKRVTVIVEHNLKEHLLCILDQEEQPQCRLDLTIKPGEQVAFKALGKVPIQLMGMTTDN